jgi:hypothetical protein
MPRFESIKLSILGGTPRGVDRLFNRFRPKPNSRSKRIPHPRSEPHRFAATWCPGGRCSRTSPGTQYRAVPPGWST